MGIKDILDILQPILSFLGVKDETVKYLIVILGAFAIGLVVIRLIYGWVIRLIKYARNRRLIKDLHPFYTDKEIETATKYYIKTKFQNVSPSEDEEPGRNYIAAARQPLIPLFLDEAFNGNKDDIKYYLVLADSGMGKTTFMINLYLSYKYKITWFWQRPKFDIKLFPMGHPNTIPRINEMTSKEKENCILLLDAFDEDNEAVANYEKRLNEILDIVWEFREVVITCRTQFFPSGENEPTEIGRFKFGGNGGEYHFHKIFLSVFSEKDIRKYLKKRFRSFLLFPNYKYFKAYGIVLKSPNLMMRPMLLSYVEDLIKIDNNKIKSGFQIYEALIEQWLIRESKKAGIRVKYPNGNYKQLLFQFSKALARYLYLNKITRKNKLSLKINEIIDNPNGLQLTDIEGNEISIDKFDQGSRSLLNRNAIGEYKFSHKSILEYFLALEVFENESFRAKFHFDKDLDTARKFFLEMLRHYSKQNTPIPNFDFHSLGIEEKEIEIFNSKENQLKSWAYISNAILIDAFKSILPRLATVSALMSLLVAVFVESVISENTKEHLKLTNDSGVLLALTIFFLLATTFSIVFYMFTKRIKKDLGDEMLTEIKKTIKSIVLKKTSNSENKN